MNRGRLFGMRILTVLVATVVFWSLTALAEQPLPLRDGEKAVKLVRDGVSIIEISTYGGAIRSFLLLQEQFNQKAKEPPAGPLRPPAEKLAEGPLDMVSTWDPTYFPYSLALEEFSAPDVTRKLQADPQHTEITGTFWSLFARDPIFTVVSNTNDSVTMVWPDPANDKSEVFLERTWTLGPDYVMQGSIRLVNLSNTDVTGRMRLIMLEWEAPSAAASGFCGGFMAAPPDMKSAVCYLDGSLESKTRSQLIEESNFDKGGTVTYAGVNSRYFLMAAIVDPKIPVQCLAAGNNQGVINAMIQWGAADGTKFKVRAAPEACIPTYLKDITAFAGRMTCERANQVLGLKGDEDIETLTRINVDGRGDEAISAKGGLLGRRAHQFDFKAFVGPKDFDALKSAGQGLDDTIDFWILGILAKPMLWLMRFSFGIIPNWGIAIIFLTLVVKLLTLYWTHKSMVQMRRMGDLKPKMDALKEKFGEDKTKLNQAMMDLYKREKVNPMGGCLPMLLQMPIWIALYRTIYGAVDLYQAPLFLWIDDLSSHDPYFVMPVLLGVLMFVQQKMSPTTGDQTQAKVMLWMMPIMFTSFMLFLPSGLVFYILVNTLLSIAHMLFMNRKGKSAVVKG